MIFKGSQKVSSAFSTATGTSTVKIFPNASAFIIYTALLSRLKYSNVNVIFRYSSMVTFFVTDYIYYIKYTLYALYTLCVDALTDNYDYTTMSQHVCEACEQVIPPTKDIPGPSTKD